MVFFERFKLLNYIDQKDISQAMTVVLADNEGKKNVRWTVYSEDVPTLLSDKNTVVKLSLKPSTVASDAYKDEFHVPVSKLPELMADKAIWLSEKLLFVPALSGHEWQCLVEKARQHSITDIFEFGFDPNNDPFAMKENVQETSNDSIMETLIYAPMLVFFMVAASDGNVDKKEIAEFQKELIKGILVESELLNEVLLQVVMRFEELASNIIQKKISVPEKLVDIRMVLDDELSPEDALSFKKSMITIGKNIAQASGGLFGMFGSKISKEEKRALSALATLLGIDD